MIFLVPFCCCVREQDLYWSFDASSPVSCVVNDAVVDLAAVAVIAADVVSVSILASASFVAFLTVESYPPWCDYSHALSSLVCCLDTYWSQL